MTISRWKDWDTCEVNIDRGWRGWTIKEVIRPLSFVVVVGMAAGLLWNPTILSAQILNIGDYPGAPTLSYQGKLYKIISGAAYEVKGNVLIFVQQLYDIDFYAQNYQRLGNTIYRVVDGKWHPVLSGTIDDGFEGAATIRDLVGSTRQWHSITLQSPMAPTVAQYVALRYSILINGGNFLDNRIEPSSARARSGTKSLRAYAVAAGGGATVSKASLESELLHFVKGDDFWFSGWFYIAQGKPLGLLDLETSYVIEYPGLRILLDDKLRPRVELKWADKPTYVASAVLPVRRWVHLRLHALLSDGADGRIEMWIDGQQVINANGQTLPLPDTVYDRLEIGITANVAGTAEVFVDDVKVFHVKQ